MDNAPFDAIIARAAALRITEAEIAERAGVGKVRWWRAKSGVTKTTGLLKVLRQVEAKLDELESGLLPCTLCGLTGDRMKRGECLHFGCPWTKTEAERTNT